jgi:hydrogenase maturation protease
VTGGAGDDATLVVGVGNPLRGDDGVGPAVAALVRARAHPGVQVAEVHLDPIALLDLWAGRRRIVLVDAVCSGAPAGTLVAVDLRRYPLPRTATASTHGFGLAQVVELGRALGRLPGELVFVGVEVGRLGAGTGLSEPVLAGVRAAAERVNDLVGPRLPDVTLAPPSTPPPSTPAKTLLRPRPHRLAV